MDLPGCVDQIKLNDTLPNATAIDCGSGIDFPEVIAHPALLSTDLPMSLAYIVIMGIALLMGTLGNLFILSCVSRRIISKVGKEFVVNLAVADLCVAGIADPMCIFGVIKGQAYFNEKEIFCQIIASMCLTACFCAFMSLTMLSFNRYIFLCHNNLYDRLYNRTSCILMCIGCWIFAFVCEFPNFIGWGGHYFDVKNHQCIWDRTANRSYSLFVTIGLIASPLVLMGFMYILIFHYIWKSKHELYTFSAGTTSKKRRQDLVWKETIKNCRLVFIIFLVFIVCWTPYATVIIIDSKDEISQEVHLFVTMLAHMHSSANCTIYFVCNRKFRNYVLHMTGFSTCHNYVQESRTKSTLSDSIPQSESAERVYSIEKSLAKYQT